MRGLTVDWRAICQRSAGSFPCIARRGNVCEQNHWYLPKSNPILHVSFTRKLESRSCTSDSESYNVRTCRRAFEYARERTNVGLRLQLAYHVPQENDRNCSQPLGSNLSDTPCYACTAQTVRRPRFCAHRYIDKRDTLCHV